MKLGNLVQARLINDNQLFIKGPLGVKYALVENVVLENNKIIANDILTKRLIKKLIMAVTSGYKLKLKIIGVGYKAQINNDTKNLELYLGFKNPKIKPLIHGIDISISGNGTVIEGKSTSLENLTQYLSDIIKMRPADKDIYKGKGVKWA